MEPIAWTAKGSHLAFLVLDRYGNDHMNGKTVFGNFTDQGPCKEGANGFNALSEFAKPINGGCGRKVIDKCDAVFSHLLLWIDANHDGQAQPEELHTLPSMGVYSLSLKYVYTPREDQFGNYFRFKAEVNPEGEPHSDTVGRYAYDIFFQRK